MIQTNVSNSDNPQAVEEAQGYLQDINILVELSATLGPEIVERCTYRSPGRSPDSVETASSRQPPPLVVLTEKSGLVFEV